MKIKHVCFDFDGVLINSLGVMEISWKLCCAKFDLDISFDEYSKLIGIPFFDILNKLNIPENLWEDLKDCYDSASTDSIDKIIKFRSVDNLFEVLDGYNISYSIFTSKTRKRTEEILRKDFKNINFLDIVCPEDLDPNKGKPSGDGLELIIEKNKLSKKDFIYIGDTKFDIICAKNAGVKFILAGWGYGDAIEESVVANNVDDFIRFIERNL